MASGFLLQPVVYLWCAMFAGTASDWAFSFTLRCARSHTTTLVYELRLCETSEVRRREVGWNIATWDDLRAAQQCRLSRSLLTHIR